jgi:rhodanese-related sulfurtransferase
VDLIERIMMQELGAFIVGHWELFLALAIILFLLGRTWFGPGAVNMLMPSEAIQMINHKDALVVDVRTDKEYQQGHVMNALHIPLGVLDDRLQELEAYKNGAVIMVCRSGARSGMAAGKLKKQGFEHVHNLGGGMLAWERASLPTTSKAGKPPKPVVPESEVPESEVPESAAQEPAEQKQLEQQAAATEKSTTTVAADEVSSAALETNEGQVTPDVSANETAEEVAAKNQSGEQGAMEQQTSSSSDVKTDETSKKTVKGAGS